MLNIKLNLVWVNSDNLFDQSINYFCFDLAMAASSYVLRISLI